MKQLLFFFLFSLSALAQQTFFVKDIITELPVAYVSIYTEDGNFKINSEKDGSFVIPETFLNSVFVFDAVGYNIQKHILEPKMIFLEPKSEVLEELVIIPKLGTKELKVGKISRQKNVNMSFSELLIKCLLGIRYTVDSGQYPFIKEVKIRTQSKVDNAQFTLRFYSAGENGQPEHLLHQKPIYGYARKGSSVVTLNLEDFNIRLDSYAFFVMFEHLYIEANSYMSNRHGKLDTFYYPNAAMSSSTQNRMWIGCDVNNEKKWFEEEFNTADNKGYMNFQIEVTLTN